MHESCSNFLEPLNVIIHLLLTIESIRNEPEKIAKQLGVSESRVLHCLSVLQRLGLIQLDQGEYKVLVDTLHLPRSSKIFTAHRDAMRLLTLHQLKNSEESNTESITVSFSANRETFERIRGLIKEMLEDAESLMDSAEEKECYQLNIDLFAWT